MTGDGTPGGADGAGIDARVDPAALRSPDRSARRRLSVVLLCVGILAGGVTAVGMSAPWLLDRVVQVFAPLDELDRIGARDRPAESVPSRRRVRRTRTAVPEADGADRLDAEGGVAPDGSAKPGAGDAELAGADDEKPDEAIRRLDGVEVSSYSTENPFEVDPDSPEFAWLAALDVDESTGEAIAATAGDPAALDIEAFVGAGGAFDDDAVELRGERRPVLEDGVPVALTGRVLDDETDVPVEGAAIVVTSTFYVREIRYDHHLREVAQSSTDADGEFFVERLNADPVHFGKGGRVFASVSAEGYAPAFAVPLGRVTPKLQNRLPDVRLVRSAHTLSGRVIDWAKREAVVGARVIATGAIDPVLYPKDQRDAIFLGAPEAVTDADGRFELTGLGAGIQWVSVHAGNDCIGNQPLRVPVTAEVVLQTLPIRGRIEGRVLDPEGRPVALAFVRGGENSTHSFADGGFVLENFVGDHVQLVAEHTRFQRLRVPAVPDGAHDLELRLVHRWPEVRLDVRHQDTGERLSALEVELRQGPEDPQLLPASPFYIAADGVHSVRIPAGVTQLVVAAPGFRTVEVDPRQRADGDVVELLLVPEQTTNGADGGH